MEKFTTSLEEFKTWESNYIPTSKVVDGVKYYFFVDENSKVKKRNGFPKIDERAYNALMNYEVSIDD